MASLILVRNVVGELQRKRTLAASRGFLAAARLSCFVCAEFQYYRMLCTLCSPPQKKTCDYIFYINFDNNCPITIIFGTVSRKSMSHRKMVSFPTSPTCNYLTSYLGKSQNTKNGQFRRKQHIVLWHVWLLEASAETARHRINTDRHLHPRVDKYQFSNTNCDTATDSTITDVRSRRLGSMYRFLLLTGA